MHKTTSISCRKKIDMSGFNAFDIITPVIVSVLTVLITQIITYKRRKVELNKMEAEMNQIKLSFQPLVFSTIQSIQNEIFKDKVGSLKGLIRSKAILFNVNQDYHAGEAFIQDYDEYMQQVYLNFSAVKIQSVRNNELENSSLFPEGIMLKFKELIREIDEIVEIQTEHFSIRDQFIPKGVDGKLTQVSELFDLIINLMRKDLHLDNTFVHDFINKQKRLIEK